VDGIRLADLAGELPVGRSSVFELIKALTVRTHKGPGADGKGRMAWVSDADAKRLRAAAQAVAAGERKIADFSSAISSRTPQTIKRPPSPDSTDAAPFLQRLEAAERAISSGLGLTTAETTWILGVIPGGSPLTRGGITATKTGKNCWLLSRVVIALLLFLPLTSCSAPKKEAFKPGVEGRSAEEVCQSTSPECQQWTALAIKCEENTRRRDEGYMGRLEPYCGQMEDFREQVTGIPLSSSPGAYAF
jgi:hypothetical protein